MVRSKSEMMIAECLLSYDIPFRYENGVKMDGFGWIYPDFTIFHVPTRKEVIWEHFGKTDDLVYLQRMAGKLRLYQKNGYAIGKDLIYTVESVSSPLTEMEIERIVRQRFLDSGESETKNFPD